MHLELPPQPQSARVARRFVVEQGGPHSDGDALAVLTSELVTNGVLHARTVLTLGVTVGAERVLVTVADAAPDEAPDIVPPDDSRPSGRGMVLVEAIAADWGVHQDEERKTVWFTLPRQNDGQLAMGEPG